VIEFSSAPSAPQPLTLDPARGEAIRLVVLDIDGTIAGENNEISPTVQAAVRAVREKGIQVAIATGAGFRAAVDDLSGCADPRA
jgi:predicted HAD superfamily phosphohydrolase YqeG